MRKPCEGAGRLRHSALSPKIRPSNHDRTGPTPGGLPLDVTRQKNEKTPPLLGQSPCKDFSNVAGGCSRLEWLILGWFSQGAADGAAVTKTNPVVIGARRRPLSVLRSPGFFDHSFLRVLFALP